ncbi:MAG: hypothetical protein V8Q57_04900 [Blautia sp.]
MVAVEDAEEEPEEPAKTLTEEEELEQFIDSIHPKKEKSRRYHSKRKNAHR